MSCSHKYIPDNDLEFLRNVENSDLKLLADILCYDKDGKERISGNLVECIKNNNYQYNKTWMCIASELQQFGGDSIMNKTRGGEGVRYREILNDICKKFDVKQENNIDNMEQKLLINFLSKYLKDKDAAFICELTKGTNISNEEEVNKFIRNIQLGKIPQIIAPKIITSIAIAVATRIIASRSLWSAFLILIGSRTPLAPLGPIGWALGAVLTIPAISGLAYRVTIPACLAVTALRRKIHDDLYDKKNNIFAERR